MAKPPTWIELSFDRIGNELRLSARGSRNEQPEPRPLGVASAKLTEFASAVEQAARHRQPLPKDALSTAQSMQRALLDGAMGTVFDKLTEAASGPMLVRLMIPKDAHELKSVPWEAACNADETLGFWGTSRNILPVRGVMSSDPWLPREVRGAVRVLAIAPTGAAGIDNLKLALDERIKTGEVEWLEPIVGSAATLKAFPQQVRMRQTPHIVHFLGHGGTMNGLPALRLADEDDEEKWLPVEVFAQHLQNSFSGTLRLVVLEACEGAKSGAFASAAEILAKAGADAVVAHLWPVRADAAQTCSTELYRALTADGADGDIAIAMNTARLSLLTTYELTAETHSPVLYLRGPHGKIFDFDNRKLAVARPSVILAPATKESEAAETTTSSLPSPLQRIVQAPFSLVLGDSWKDTREAFDAFRDKLRADLSSLATPPPADANIGTLAQWFALYRGGEVLEQEFQDSFDIDMAGPAIVAALARWLCPGVHTTLMRNPWLEHGLAEQQPDRTIYVIQPYDAGAFIVKRDGGGKKWERLRAAPDTFDDTKDILILRPYRGYTSNKKFAPPLLTEDDYFLRLRDIWSGSAMPPRLAELVGGTLSRRPALLLGLSLLTAHHRMLLQTLYSRGLPRGTLAVVDEGAQEREMWERGAGLPGKEEGIEVVETSASTLCSWFGGATTEGAA